MAAKIDRFIEFSVKHLNQWICSVCASGSNQPAAIFREAKKRGYVFEEPSPNRWAVSRHCSSCGEDRSHYRLLQTEPQFAEKKRVTVSSDQRRRILSLLGNRDAFTGASISSVAEIDHKVPWTRLEKDIDASSLSDEEIGNHFQLLTREHNLLKDRQCSSCKLSGIRPPFFGIAYWFVGDEQYLGSCEGCGWNDGVAWRERVNSIIGRST